jgi:uncharacterized protein YndB with AHSA1/START domain
MPMTQLGNETTTVFVQGAEYVMERVFDAPRELVWAALTEPERIPRWWGQRQDSTTVEQMEVRVGGRWRWVAHSSQGDAPFTGEYLEIDPPAKLVNTETFDVEPFNQGEPAIVTQTLEDLGDGRTKLVSRSVFPSEESLQGALSMGMTRGAIESWDRLAEEVARG